MNESYLISTSIGFAGLYLLYRIALARLTYFQPNRILLVLGSILVAVAPFINLNTGFIQELGVPALAQLPEIEIAPNRWGPAAFNFSAWLRVTYILVLSLLLSRHIWSIIQTFRIISAGDRIGSVVIVPESVPAFSFFGTIVIPEGIDDLEYEAIIRHESIHVAQHHSVDRLLFSVLQAVFWFNPFVWLLNREIVLVHEYLADQGTVEQLDQAEYSRIILDLAVGKGFLAISDPVNTFSEKSIIKNRFNMMYSNRSNPMNKLRYALVLPLITTSILLFSCNENLSGQVDGKVYDKVEVMPEYPGGFDKLITYMTEAIKYPEDAEKGGIEGKVMVSFTVSETGEIEDVETKNSVFPSIDKQAVSVVSKMPKWTPGSQDGANVKVKMVLPIVYKLRTGSSSDKPPVPPAPPTAPTPPSE